ncbi:hypothetical protein AMTR_s00036p00200680 [Amborella trichopoda]|uniref:Uncharacterized protein n=1 Tax=Amborella trichopoda TaxID=13333 RepID=U5D4W4_AMBTC|nr:hypothetical protein AMTR_s00036p00200680 [Amborella trichopoda]
MRGGDARNWDEEGYRTSVIEEREALTLTVFRTAFAPSPNPNPNPDIIVAACSDGSVAPFSISSFISSYPSSLKSNDHHQHLLDNQVADPLYSLQGHQGPAYDVKFYGDGENALLLSCGDDGRILAWSWKEILNSVMPSDGKGNYFDPVFYLVNPQHKGPWGALSPIPETNAISTDVQGGRIFAATGDSCAYSWDVETGKCTMEFRGHSDYLHCIAARCSSNQIITGSEDGTGRIWDCRSGKCTRVLNPTKDMTEGKGQKHAYRWVSCVAVDASETWLACGSGSSLSLWSLPTYDCIWSYETQFPIQDALFDKNQILAVGAEPVLTRFNIDGKVLSQIQCAPQSAFSVSLHPTGEIVVIRLHPSVLLYLVESVSQHA